MSLKVESKKQTEPIVIEILEYDNLQSILSKIVVPFSEHIKKSGSPDLYNGQERIAFRNRYPSFQDLMCAEFESEMLDYQISQIKELIL
jgi:hypothetical protein